MRDYIITDVFTDRAYGGNPLAVFLDGSALATSQMQTIAREMNLSETTFVTPLDDTGAHWRVRIFTPTSELPFAGHPTIGTAVVLAERGLTQANTEIVFEELIGPVRVALAPGAATLFVTGAPEIRSVSLTAASVAELVGLDTSFLAGTAWEAGYGNGMMFVPVIDVEAVAQAVLRGDRWHHHEPALWSRAVFCFAVTDTAPGHAALHARMFAPALGVPEDPATGSAAAAIAGSIKGLAPSLSGTLRLAITQGVEMGRPSYLNTETTYADMGVTFGPVTGVSVGGHAVIVAEGRLLRLP